MYSNILAIVAGLSTLAAAAPSGFTKEPCAQLSQVYQQHKHDLDKNSNSMFLSSPPLSVVGVLTG